MLHQRNWRIADDDVDDDVIKWKHFPCYALCAGKSPMTGEFSLQRPVTRSFDVFFGLRLKKNDWLNNRNAHVLRCHRAHYDVTVMGNLGAVVKQDIYTAQKLIWDEPIMYSSVHTKKHEHLLDVVVFVSVRYWLVLTISLKLTSLVLVHHTIAPVPLQHSWIIWVKKSHNSPMNW